MRIVELILDEAQEMMGIDAISIVESPAIQEDFVALNSDEIKLAEVSKEKKILMGALLVPNKPIYRKNGDDEYYIYFSKDTIAKASQLYLKNGYQGNSTLEHANALQGLTLVESWLVEDEVNDKSRKYGMNVPVGTWMGAVKVDNDEVWNEYVKTNKVRGFSIEGYFADKMEQSDKSNKEDMEEVEAAQLLSAIEKIVRGEKVEKIKLANVKEVQSLLTKMSKLEQELKTAGKELEKFDSTFSQYKKEIDEYNKKQNYYSDLTQEYIDIKKGGAGVSMETVDELADKAAELGLNEGDIPIINKAYAAFNSLADAVRPVMQLDSKIYRYLN